MDNTLSFYTNTEHTGAPAFTANLPEEQFLDTANTKFEESFSWSAAKYPGTTDPDLDGKPVLVLVLKGDEGATGYGFLDVSKLWNAYQAAAGDGSATVTITGTNISANVNLSDDQDNIISKDANGKLLAKHQNIRGKADKPSSATADNLAAFDANKNPVDSGIAKGDVVVKISTPTEDNLIAQDANGKIKDAGIAKGSVQQKLAAGAFTENNFRLTDANGFAKDAGYGLATDAEVDAMLDEVFGAQQSGT